MKLLLYLSIFYSLCFSDIIYQETFGNFNSINSSIGQFGGNNSIGFNNWLFDTNYNKDINKGIGIFNDNNGFIGTFVVISPELFNYSGEYTFGFYISKINKATGVVSLFEISDYSISNGVNINTTNMPPTPFGSGNVNNVFNYSFTSEGNQEFQFMYSGGSAIGIFLGVSGTGKNGFIRFDEIYVIPESPTIILILIILASSLFSLYKTH